MTTPHIFETEMEEDDYYVDLVIYPISPSISMPSSYPMLDANPESIDLSKIGDMCTKFELFVGKYKLQY